MTLKQKLIGGFGGVAGILALAVSVTIYQVGKTSEMTGKVINLRAPTAAASLHMLNGMNQSLAGLRGWILLGKEGFKKERVAAWESEIDPFLAKMTELSKNWTNPENVRRLKEITADLEEFRGYQEEIEDIAQTHDNNPAMKILLVEAAPQAAIMAGEITAMIDEEAKRGATAKRKEILGMMADTRGTLGLGLANIRGYLLTGDIKFKNKFDTLWAKNTRRFGDLEDNAGHLNAKQLQSFRKFRKARNEFVKLPPKMFELRGAVDWNLANYWLGTKAAPSAKKIKINLDEMVANQQALMIADAGVAVAMTTQLKRIQYFLLVIGVSVSMLLGWFIAQGVLKPLNRVVEMIKDIAEGEGDLTKRLDVKTEDEIGELARWFDTFVEKVHDIVARVAETTQHVSAATTQLSATAQEMATGAEEQTTQTTQVATSMEEMSATVQQVAKNAMSAAGSAKASGETAEKGGEVVQKTVEGIRRIADSVSQLQSVIEGLSKNSEKIGEIVGVIDDVADQTNLLALNAAIEAARAGEQGRGFAVVADEVRKLAERTTSSTKEIAGMVKSIQGDTTQAVQSMSSGSEEVTKGVTLAEEAGRSLKEIVAGAKQVEDMIQQIASSAEEQSAATEQISSNVESIASVVKQNAAGARQISSASNELDRLAVELKGLVSQFKLREGAVRKIGADVSTGATPAEPAALAGPEKKPKKNQREDTIKLPHFKEKPHNGEKKAHEAAKKLVSVSGKGPEASA